MNYIKLYKNYTEINRIYTNFDLNYTFNVNMYQKIMYNL